MKLYLFNPENDIALAYGRRRFTMSQNVARLHDDGALLPMWYASDCDAVLGVCHDGEWLDFVRASFGIGAVVTESCRHGVYNGSPWGWSFDVSRRLSSAGAAVISDEKIDAIASLSHRRVTVRIMQRLHDSLDFPLPRVPVEISDTGSLLRRVSESPVYVKAPWSSSGRGVFRVDTVDERVLARVEGVLRRQGSVLVEDALEKKCDFAMLFHISGGIVSWVGYSFFFNAVGDAYGGNMLADDSRIEDLLVANGAVRERLHAIRNLLVDVLADIIGDAYEGYFGVDMLITESGMIAPCIELNLRMTMGVVAHILKSRYLPDGVTGIYRVLSDIPSSVTAPVIENGKLLKGSVFLTPPSAGGFNFIMEAGGQLISDRCL